MEERVEKVLPRKREEGGDGPMYSYVRKCKNNKIKEKKQPPVNTNRSEWTSAQT
jgi:hypothetical protein